MVRPIGLEKAALAPALGSTAVKNTRDAGNFAGLLRQELDKTSGVRFSGHAQQRLESRGIRLSEAELSGIGQALDAASAKGARESLFLTDRVALVVNVPNRTVITAMSTKEAGNAVFTNIDSAVVVPTDSASPQETVSNGLAPEWGGPRTADRLTRCME